MWSLPVALRNSLSQRQLEGCPVWGGGGGGGYLLIGGAADFVCRLLGQGTSSHGGAAIACGTLEHSVYGRILY